MSISYNTWQDAATVFGNSGVFEFVDTDEKQEAVINDMYRNDKSPEEAVADVLGLDATDRRNICADSDGYEVFPNSDELLESTLDTRRVELDKEIIPSATAADAELWEIVQEADDDTRMNINMTIDRDEAFATLKQMRQEQIDKVGIK